MKVFERQVRWLPLFAAGAAMALTGMVGTATARSPATG